MPEPIPIAHRQQSRHDAVPRHHQQCRPPRVGHLLQHPNPCPYDAKDERTAGEQPALESIGLSPIGSLRFLSLWRIITHRPENPWFVPLTGLELMERATRFERATSSLARKCSTTELRPLCCGPVSCHGRLIVQEEKQHSCTFSSGNNGSVSSCEPALLALRGNASHRTRYTPRSGRH